jgi:predicted acyl esterase
MFATGWATSQREFRAVRDRNVRIPVSAGFDLVCDVVRPDSPGKFPVILSLAPYPIDDQMAPLTPSAMRYDTAHMEAGDPFFYARRGYVHVIGNLRGTGQSGGLFDHMGPDTIRDVYDAIDWAARQHWSDGNVGMFGMSYFGMIQPLVAMLRPSALKALFCPFAVTDQYRDTYYKGGIFGYAFLKGWSIALRKARIRATFVEKIGEDRFRALVDDAKHDPELAIVPDIMAVLNDIDDPVHRFLAEIVVNKTLGDHYAPRNVDYDVGLDVPAYFGACWGIYGLHLPGAFRSFENWRGPRRTTIGPPAYLDRPIVQYQWESLRWFDHWLKGVDTGMLDEDPVQLFVVRKNEWKSAKEWPLPETRWTPFYLHRNGLMFERDVWAGETPSSYIDSRYERGGVAFTTPPFCETTEICGPIVLNLYGSTTGTEILWFVSLLEIDLAGEEHLLTRGWQRGSLRKLDPALSKPWQPVQANREREPLDAGEIYLFSIEVRPYAIEMRPGTKFRLRIRSTDQGDAVPDILHNHAVGLLAAADTTVVSIHHDEDHASHLLLPITKGNRIGMFVSGGVLGPLSGAFHP